VGEGRRYLVWTVVPRLAGHVEDVIVGCLALGRVEHAADSSCHPALSVMRARESQRRADAPGSVRFACLYSTLGLLRICGKSEPRYLRVSR
jgi:hypothetical protein